MLSNGGGVNSIPTSKLLLALVNLLMGIVLAVLSWWALNTTTRQMQMELDLRDIRTWRETIKPQDDADHVMLMRLSTDFTQRAEMLQQAVGLIREMKLLIDVLSTQQIAQREALVRIEDAMIRNSTLTGKRK